jgi:hypothetical protein
LGSPGAHQTAKKDARAHALTRHPAHPVELRGLPLGVSFHAPRVCVECGRESSIQV